MARIERYRRVHTALSENFDGVTVVVDHHTGQVARLNAAAGCVWDTLGAAATLDEVVAALVSRFAVARPTAQADAKAAIGHLAAVGLVIRS